MIVGNKTPPALIRKITAFAGDRSITDFFNCAGCKVKVDAVLLQNSHPGLFDLHLYVGGQWWRALEITPADEMIEKLRRDKILIERGPSPQQVESRRQQEIKAENDLYRKRRQEEALNEHRYKMGAIRAVAEENERQCKEKLKERAKSGSIKGARLHEAQTRSGYSDGGWSNDTHTCDTRDEQGEAVE